MHQPVKHLRGSVLRQTWHARLDLESTESASARRCRRQWTAQAFGCNDILGATTYPPLTTVSSRFAEAGKSAVSLLVELPKTRGVRDVHYVLDTQLVGRSTTGPRQERSSHMDQNFQSGRAPKGLVLCDTAHFRPSILGSPRN
jgi:Periplasmic binding protein-like domain